MPFNPKSLANLKPITSENARECQKKGTAVKLANKAKREEFIQNAKAYALAMDNLPKLASLDVIRMAMHAALAKENLDDAARYAAMLAEYEKPKLQRIDQTVTNKLEDLSEEDLKKIAEAEGLKI